MKIRWFPQKAQQMSQAGAVEGLFRASEFLLAKANETVPLAEATLKDSGDTDVDESALVATVSYDTPYAAVQHESRSFTHPHGRRAKWLQLTFQEQVRPVRDILARAMKGKFG